MLVEGLFVGDRIANYVGTLRIEYETHNMYAEITINPKTKKFLGIFGRKQKLPSDHLEVKFYRREGDKSVLLASGKGSWLENLEYDDNEEIWNIFGPQDDWEFEPSLPSDSSYRPDIKFIADKDYDQAQTAKESLENRQRADKALREKANK